MIIVESVPVSRFWAVLFYMADWSMTVFDSGCFLVLGRYLADPEEDRPDCLAERLIDYLERRAGLS